MMRRILTTIAIGAALVAALFVAPAEALTITGGTAEQRAYVQEVLAASWVELPLDGITIQLRAGMGEGNPGITVGVKVSIADDIGCGYGSLLGEVTAHELGHVDYAFWPLCAKQAWQELVGSDSRIAWTYQQWLTNPAEAWAECSKCLWPARYLVWNYPRTCLTVPVGDGVRAFRSQWVTNRNDDFTDQPWLDLEGWRAVGWCADQGLFCGYPDGTFRAFDTLTRRHVALIAERAGLCTPAGWTGDYSAALRGDVRQQWPDMDFLNEDWGQALTRVQFARLLWRAR